MIALIPASLTFTGILIVSTRHPDYFKQHPLVYLSCITSMLIATVALVISGIDMETPTQPTSTIGDLIRVIIP